MSTVLRRLSTASKKEALKNETLLSTNDKPNEWSRSKAMICSSVIGPATTSEESHNDIN